MKELSLSSLIVLFIVILLSFESTFAQYTYIVQARNNYTIDGNASDWSSITTVHSVQDQYGNIVATFKVSYDGQGLYFYVEVVDATPLVNSATYDVFQELFYQGDSLTVCFGPHPSGAGTNQRFVIGPLAGGGNEMYVMRPTWSNDTYSYNYYTSALGTYHVSYVWHAKDSNAQVALGYITNGWSAEFSIPYYLLGYTPITGDYIPFDIEVIASNAFGTSISSANWWHSTGASTSIVDIVGQATLYPYQWGQALLTVSDMGPQQAVQPAKDPAFVARGVNITFNVPDSGLAVSVNIVKGDSDFIIVELVRAKLMSKGTNTIYWNGRDSENKPVPGNINYRAKVATFQPLTATYAVALGNSGRPSWVTSDGKGSLGGIHYGPKYILSADTFYNTSLPITNDIYISGSADEGTSGLRRVNSSFVAEWTLGSGIFNNVQGIAQENGLFCNVVVSYVAGSIPIMSCYNATTGLSIRRTTEITGAVYDTADQGGTLAIFGNLYIYGDALQDTLYINTYNSSSATWLAQRSFAIAGLISTCKKDAQTLYIVTATSVYTYNVLTNQRASTPVITGYTSLSACTVDKDGNIFISETDPSNQIFKLSSTGTLVKTYGVAGGRPLRAVPYNPLQFKNVYSLAVSASGLLYAVERNIAPRRIAIIDVTTGKWTRDFYGPVGYTTNIVDLDDASKVMYNADTDQMFVEVKIDYEASQANPTDTQNAYNITGIHYFSQNGKDNSTSVGGGIDIWQDWAIATRGYGAGTIFTANNGKRYMWFSSNSHGASVVSMYNTVIGAWIPVSSISNANKGWSDLDHDGLVNATSEVFQQFTGTAYPAFTHCDKDLILYGGGYYVKPVSIDSVGVPSYRGSPMVKMINATNNVLAETIFNPPGLTSYSIVGAPSTTVPGLAFVGNNIGPAHNQGFWDRASGARVMGVQNGTVLWIAGHHHFAQTNTGGELDGIVIYADISSEFVTYTYDGFTTGWLLVDPNTQLIPQYGPTSITIENAGQALWVKDPITGKRLLITITTGDVRILEVTGPFDSGIQRSIVDNIFLPTSLPRSSTDDLTSSSIAAYPLNYLTMGDGSDATFYGNGRPYQDGYDFEWRSTVPSIYIYDRSGKTPVLKAEARLRRDGGELGIFIDVLDSSKNFPYFPPANLVKNVTDLFGVVGVEILIGTALNGRTTPAAGDTRIFLTATYAGASTYTGYVLACKPNSSPISGSLEEFRQQTSMGFYTGTAAPTSPLNFAKISVVPGALTAVAPRTDNQGYRLEAYIPLALLGDELTSVQLISMLRTQVDGTPTGTQYFVNSTFRRDLNTFPFSFNAAVYSSGPFSTHINSSSVSSLSQTRFPWVQDGFSGFDPTKMNPSLWGAISHPPTISLALVSTTGTPTPFSYLDTITSSPVGYGFYTAKVSNNGIYGGGWFTVNGTSKVVTSPPLDGFSLTYISGDGGPSTNTVWRYPYWDSSNLHIPYAPNLVNAELVFTPNATFNDIVNLTMRLTTKLGSTVGIMHILYGQQGGNSFIDGWLNITDVNSGITLSGLSNPDLRFPVTYLQGGQMVKESTFLISGTNDLYISAIRNRPRITLFPYISAVWVEVYSPNYFSSPASVPFNALPYAVDYPVIRIDYYLGSTLIGSNVPGQIFSWNNVQAGSYQVTAVASDQFQASVPSSPVSVTVYGPVISGVFPANGSTVYGDVKIAVNVSMIGPSTPVSTEVNVNYPKGKFVVELTSLPFSSSVMSLSAGQVSFTVKAVDSAGAYTIQSYYFTYGGKQVPSNNSGNALAFSYISLFIGLFFALVLTL